VKGKIIAAAIAIPVLAGLAYTLMAATTFTPSAAPVGYVPQPAITGREISSGDQVAFRPDYDRNNWSGNLLGISVGTDGSADNSNADWAFSVRVTAQNYDSGRKIFTRNGSAGVTFRWNSLSGTQQAALGTATTGPHVLDYVRGDAGNEAPAGDGLRSRVISAAGAPVIRDVVGAIVHSTPLYSDDLTDRVVYVGANDGMLHAIDAANGNELWAYVPSFLIPSSASNPGLKALSVAPAAGSDYNINYYVDGSQVVGRDITIASVSKNILVGTVGAGGKGLYALDITDQTPATEAAAAAMSLWEVTSASSGFTNLGYTYSTPRLGVANDGSDVVVIGNGYMSSSGLATLLVINAKTGALIREISTGVGTVASPNGLSTPTLVTNSSGVIDYVYAGDLNGNLWKFDLTSDTPSSWGIKGGIAGTTSDVPLFTTSPAQAITTAPAFSPHIYGGRMVTFATGRMLLDADKTDTATHYVYGIWDGAPATNTALLDQSLTQATFVVGSSTTLVRVATGNVPIWTAFVNGDPVPHHRGWKTPLPVAGERVVGDGTFIEGGRYYFTSTNPTDHSTVPVGATWLNQLNYMTGGTSAKPIYNLNGDQIVDDNDRIKDGSNLPIMSNLGLPVSKFLRNGLASQPILVSETHLDDTLFTFNGDGQLPDNPDRGVSGGHFDVDIFYNPPNDNRGNPIPPIATNGTSTLSTSGTQHIQRIIRHYHQYDDAFDVTGVNFLNPSVSAFRLANVPAGVMNNATQFKVLVHNQYYSPAAMISVGGASAVPVRNYGGLTAATLSFASLPTYNRTNIASLEIELPLTAFAVRDWTFDSDPNNDEDERTGLLPTSFNCVVNDRRGGSASWPILQGALHNGALTVQLVKAATPDSHIGLNVPGHPEMGWRVLDAYRSADILVEYSIYWHMPNEGFSPAPYSSADVCTQDASWTDSPPQETLSVASPVTPANGSDDPKGGAFSAGNTVVSDVTSVDGATTTRTTTYADGSSTIITTVDNGDGTLTVTTVEKDSAGHTTSTTVATVAASGSKIGEGGEQVNSPYGRISWRDRPAN
jgi:hypothetical protein